MKKLLPDKLPEESTVQHFIKRPWRVDEMIEELEVCL